MSIIELRALIYVAVLFLGGWGGWTLASHHYERLEAVQKLAQDQALQAQQAKAISDLRAQQAATVAAEKQYADLKVTADSSAQQLARSVSEYAALHRSLLSATGAAASLADAASKGAQRDSELAGLVQQAVAACQGDAAELTALQTWVQGTAQPPTR